MQRHVSLLLTFAFTLCSCSRSTQSSAESNKALFRHAVDLWATGNISALEQVVAPGYIGHTSTGGRDIQGLRQRIEAFHKLYSNISFHIEDQMADGDKVVTRLTADVTMRDSGKSARLMGINISRIADGKIVEVEYVGVG
jgi:ketosteroid isomerase-like protein